VLPPGKAQCPFHSHRAEEEMFLVLEGEGELRFGNEFGRRVLYAVADPRGIGSQARARHYVRSGLWMRSLEMPLHAIGGAHELPDAMHALPGGMPVRDLQDFMAYPFFSLAKSKRVAPIVFRSGDLSVRVEGTAQHGIATIWDADVPNWARARSSQRGCPLHSIYKSAVQTFHAYTCVIHIFMILRWLVKRVCRALSRKRDHCWLVKSFNPSRGCP